LCHDVAPAPDVFKRHEPAVYGAEKGNFVAPLPLDRPPRDIA